MKYTFKNQIEELKKEMTGRYKAEKCLKECGSKGPMVQLDSYCLTDKCELCKEDRRSHALKCVKCKLTICKVCIEKVKDKDSSRTNPGFQSSLQNIKKFLTPKSKLILIPNRQLLRSDRSIFAWFVKTWSGTQKSADIRVVVFCFAKYALKLGTTVKA